MRELKLNLAYYKVLITIKELNDDNFFPLNEGVFKILTGSEDEETLMHQYISTYGTLTSFSSKKVCRLTMMLFRYGYLGKIFDSQTKKLYFQVSEKGLAAVDAFLKKHNKPFSRKQRKVSTTIVKIDSNL